MLVVRPVAVSDLDGLLALAQLAGVGLTSLPKDADLLARRIRKSVDGMAAIPDRPGGESYLFVMEDAAAGRPGTGRIVGASGVVSKVGGFEPFYAYRVEHLAQRCDQLSVSRTMPVLNLVGNHDGPAEIGSLFLSPDHRGGSAGRFLQLVRFLFVARHRQAFETTFVSELRGVVDAVGRSPFWDGLGRHFFEIDFARADHLSVVNKRFIADLMPTYPIYLCLLPPDARQAVGQVHEHSRPALATLAAEGFRGTDLVDIFDGGPCVSCPRDEIRTVRECRTAPLAAIRPGPPDGPPTHMVARGDGPFRACLDVVRPADGDRVDLSAAVAEALGVDAGDPVTFAPLRAVPKGAAA